MAINSACNVRLQSSEILLANLVTTVGFLIDINSSKQSVFSIWSGVNHLHSRVKSILRHGAKIRHHLIFSQPSFAAFDIWLEARLLDYSLVDELIKVRNDICEFYYDWAFFRDENLFLQFVDGLRVLGTRDIKVFCEIELISAELVTSSRNRRMDAQISEIKQAQVTESVQELENNVSSGENNSSLIVVSAGVGPTALFEIETITVVSEASDTDEASSSSNLSIPTFSYASVSPICSPPEFSHISGVDFETNREEPEEFSQNVASSSSPSNKRHKIVRASPTKLKSIFLDAFLQDQEKEGSFSIDREKSPEISRKAPQSFLESGGLIQPPALGNFPLPQKGQSLTSFLSSLSDSMPDLDRENAHFNVSEALISAFEVLKVDRIGKRQIQRSPDIPDEMEDMFGTVQGSSKPKCLVEPDSIRKFYSGKRFPRPPILYTETEESEVEYWRQQPRKPPSHLRKKPRVGKLGSDGNSISVLSTTEISSSSSSNSIHSNDDIASSSFSAENVALNLLRNAKVKEEHLPPAFKLQWLVTETETPQSLLPLPKNLTTSASESENDYLGKTESGGKPVRLRGTQDWAPPRPQIIFTVHPSPSTHILTETQRYRCAGCGMRVDPKYASTFRYCFYLGRYFCTGCHTGKKARLPQFILHKWDFSPYLVSNFSATLLESLQSDPVYNVMAINPNLTKKVKLNNFRNYRIQLAYLNEYLKNCKSAETLYQDYLKFPTYYAADVDLCSLEDLINVRFSTGLPMILKEFVSEAMRHVLNCKLCRNLGFVCEICSRNEVIFPFQINRASSCPKCCSCYHLKCFNSTLPDCPKCLRVTKRRDTLEISPASIAE